MNPDQNPLALLKSGQPLVAMLAPSFPIVFNPNTIVGMLKRIGFQNVVEVSAGAQQTNDVLISALKKDDKAKFITSPCPNIVRIIRIKYPQALKYLALEVDSPMVATAKIVHKNFPQKQAVFIGPCLVKRLEALEDHPDLNILCVTFKDIQQIFHDLGISEQEGDNNQTFDLVHTETRLYPISGGLAQSSGVTDLLNNDAFEVVSGPQNVDGAIKRFLESDHIRLLDILFCDGGCISGPGIVSPMTIEARRKKIMDHWIN